MEDMKAKVEEYINTLNDKGTEAAKEYVQKLFGVEGNEDFKAEEYERFANEVISEVMDRNIKLAEDEEAAEEVVQDEAEL